MKKSFAIIFEDEEILVVNKAAGLLTVPDRFDHVTPNLIGMLKKRYGNVLTVHRLDRDTSGLIVFAKSAAAHKNLSEQFANGEVEKYYRTIVHNIPQESEGVIENRIVESSTTRGKMIVHKKGKESKSKYKLLKAFNHYSLLEIRIYTGRTHQIRVHMNSIGHPVLGDGKYGPSGSFYLSSIKRRKFKLQKDTLERPLLTRQALHSYQLGFKHPTTSEPLTFTGQLPKDMKATIQQLEKWDS